MTVKDRCAKLHKALDKLKATRRRINRLRTAEDNWQRKVQYHTSKLTEERETELNASLAAVSGTRKFRA